MATIQGGGSVSPTITDGPNQAVVNQINAILRSANAIGTSVAGAGTAPPPSASLQLVVDTSAGNPIASGGGITALSYKYFVVGDTFNGITVGGGSFDGQGVVLGAGPITYRAAGGSGTVVGGDGNKTVDIGAGSNFTIYTGSGDDTINMVGSRAVGTSTVQAGGGSNAINLGAQSTAIRSGGQDTIAVGTGNTTVQAIGSVKVSVSGGSGARTVVNGTADSTVAGGSGSATVIGAAGGGQFAGGSGGNNLLISGSGQVYLTGAGDGDVLIATSTNAPSVLQAGGGNETLLGALSTMNNTFAARSANALIIAGPGNDTIIGGSGASTVTGGFGSDTFRFNAAAEHGGAVTITDFTPGVDRVSLVGYGDAPANLAAAAQRVGAGASRIVLSDGTSITFVGLNAVNASYFG